MKEIQALQRAFKSRKMGALLLLGFASGLPLFLTSRTLQAWLEDAKIDIAQITLFSLLGLPYSLKFLWSPLLDRFTPPLLGLRRGWLVITQIALVIAITSLGFQQPSQNDQVLQILAVSCLAITFFSATQDIVGDAYRTDILEPEEAKPGASVWVLGYRLSLFAALPLALFLTDRGVEWNIIYFLMAGLMAVSVFVTIWAPREPQLPQPLSKPAPLSSTDVIFLISITGLVTGALWSLFAKKIELPVFNLLLAALLIAWIVTSLLMPAEGLENLANRPPQNLKEAIFLPFKEFFLRVGFPLGCAILAFIFLYRLGDSLVGITSTPFLLQTGFTKTDLAGMFLVGLVPTTVGVLTGGILMTRIGVNRCLWIFGLLQLISNLGYYAVAQAGKDISVLFIAVNVENFCAGLVTVVMVAFLMSLCNHRFTTTQFALFSSLMAISRDVLSAPAGVWAKQTGWSGFFLLTVAAAIPGLLLLPIVAPWKQQITTIPRPGLNEEEV
ncbi:AmpG family muropeptide MFS transporter [Calothrix sp. PCC 6303]|uniref:AmpG family muropeptide MFS transporter n=1 Tax=Calothrix sp. PCC 6303 TaxID=1170562 RepID=UPI0002A0048A|nr:AmpG family muropeptide MFS transporter [Calothrix sp. PCC 6303]AFZ00967.1 major facilitator superfamily MFS_1 [Calothrix sp. PCC 6303]